MADKKKSPTDLGTNRTGISLSPIDSQKLIKVAAETQPSSDGNAPERLAAVRAGYIEQHMTVGTMPPPVTVQGVVDTAKKMLTGNKATVLLDKLGERLAFERTGARLYQAFIDKLKADGTTDIPIDKIKEIHTDELRHFQILHDAIVALGGDPTAVTPCADVTAVASMGLLQVVSDPRITITQSLQAILIAELADTDGWQLLIGLLSEAGEKEMAERFQVCFAEEERHLQTARNLLRTCSIKELHGATP